MTAFLCEKDSEMFCLVTLHIGTFRPLSLDPLEHNVSTKPTSPLSASYSELTVISVSSSSPALRFSLVSPTSSSLKMKSSSPPVLRLVSYSRSNSSSLAGPRTPSARWTVRRRTENHSTDLFIIQPAIDLQQREGHWILSITLFTQCYENKIRINWV